MPYRYKRRRYARGRRRTFARRKRARPVYRRYRPVQPKLMYKRLKYVQGFSLDPGTNNALSVYRFRCNSVYDPDYTGTGHQPYGYDQITPLYSQFNVRGAMAVAKFYSGTDTQRSLPVIVGGVMDDDNTTVNATMPAILEQSRVRWKILPARYNGSAPKTIVLKWSDRKWFAGTDNGNHAVPVNSNPTFPAYFKFFAGMASNTSDSNPVYCVVTIYYLVRFLEPSEVGQS